MCGGSHGCATRIGVACDAPVAVLDLHALQQIVDRGGHLWACCMSADLQRLEIEDLHDEVEAIISAPDFIEKTEGAQLLFIWRGPASAGATTTGRSRELRRPHLDQRDGVHADAGSRSGSQLSLTTAYTRRSATSTTASPMREQLR